MSTENTLRQVVDTGFEWERRDKGGGQFTFQIVPVLHLKLRAHGLDRSLHGAIVYATLFEVCAQLIILLLLLTKLQQEGVVEF